MFSKVDPFMSHIQFANASPIYCKNVFKGRPIYVPYSVCKCKPYLLQECFQRSTHLCPIFSLQMQALFIARMFSKVDPFMSHIQFANASPIYCKMFSKFYVLYIHMISKVDPFMSHIQFANA